MDISMLDVPGDKEIVSSRIIRKSNYIEHLPTESYFGFPLFRDRKPTFRLLFRILLTFRKVF